MFGHTKEFVLSCILALLSVSLASLLWRDTLLTTALLALISGCMLALAQTKKEFNLYITVFVLGPIAEIIAIYFGAWSYALPTAAGIPLWLPFLWGIAGLFIIRAKQAIDRRSGV